MARHPSFDELLAEHSGSVLRVCRSILRDEHLGADAAQEALLRAWRRFASGTVPARPSSWLRKVAVTTSLDFARRARALGGALERLGTERAPRPVEAASEAAADAELRARFEAALEQLSEGQRTVFLLRHECGLPLSEVADVLGVSLPTAKTQFARACLKLQVELAAFDPGIRT